MKTMLLCLLLTLPIMIVCYLLYFHYRSNGRKTAKILVKCGATLMCVITALMGLIATGQDVATSLLLWSVVFCIIGDGLLEIHFVSGMAAFGAGHVMLIVWIGGMFAMANGAVAAAAGIWLVLYGAALWMFRAQLKKLGRKLPAFLLYPAVLMAMAAMALLLPSRFGACALSVAIGGALFAISDLMVAKGIFDGLSPAMDRFALAIYYIAVDCLALGAWLL